MVMWVIKHPNHKNHSVFHHGLIKLLITTELEKSDRSFQHFILWSGFEPEAQMHYDEEIRGQYRRKIAR